MGFWGTLGKIGVMAGGAAAAPFTGGASLIPALKMAAIQAGVGIGSSLLAKKLTGGQSSTEKTALAGQQELLKQGQQFADTLKPQATSLIDLSQRSLQPAASYWSSILSGDRSKAMDALQPELDRISSGYDTARTTAAELTPRGGSQASTLANLPYAQAKDTAGLLNTMRPVAAQALTDVGTRAGQVGQAGARNVLDFLGDSQRTNASMLNYELQRKQQQYQTSQGIGSFIYDILKRIGGGGGAGGASGGGGMSASLPGIMRAGQSAGVDWRALIPGSGNIPRG